MIIFFVRMSEMEGKTDKRRDKKNSVRNFIAVVSRGGVVIV